MEHVAGGGAGIGFHLRNYQPTYPAFFSFWMKRNQTLSSVMKLRPRYMSYDG